MHESTQITSVGSIFSRKGANARKGRKETLETWQCFASLCLAREARRLLQKRLLIKDLLFFSRLFLKLFAQRQVEIRWKIDLDRRFTLGGDQ